MTEAYPNLEILKLTTYRHNTMPNDDSASLSALSFAHLTSLSLCDFQLGDGIYLPEVNVIFKSLL